MFMSNQIEKGRRPDPNHPDAKNIAVAKQIGIVEGLMPRVRDWWFGLYGILMSIEPFEERDRMIPVGHKGTIGKDRTCSARPDKTAEFCGGKPHFVVVSGFFDDTEEKPTMAQLRHRFYCAKCMYLSMSRALTQYMNPRAMRNADVEDDNGEGMFMISERVNFLQSALEKVVKHLEKHDPDTLEELNRRVVVKQESEGVGQAPMP
jgi:hypothetical protein